MMNAQAANDEARSAGKGRIQVVDDDPDFAESFSEFLEMKGYQVRIANSASDAVKLAAEFAPELALIDIRLGRTSGLDLISALREEKSDIICLLMTGYADTDTAIEAIRLGAFDYLRKPLRHNKVLATIEFCFLKLRLEADKRAAEEALRESEERYRTLVELSPDAIFVSRDGKFSFVNPGAVKFFGAESPDSLADRKVTDFVHPEDRDAWRRRAGEISDGKDDGALVEEGRLKVDGREFVAESAGVPFGDDGAAAILSIERDITERKAVEEWLRQAYKMEALGQHTAGVAHEFNNLLAIIIGNLDFLMEMFETRSDATSHIRPALSAAERGAELTQRLLAYSRLQPLAPRSSDLNKLISEASALLDPLVGGSVGIKFALAEDLAPVLIDSARMEAVILNLAGNARDAMPDGGTLRLETANVALDEAFAEKAEIEPGRYVLLTVRDDGEGMPAEVAARAFDPFFTTKEVGEGTGLGLSMVQGFVKQSGGHVEIDSREGQYTEIRLYLPRADRTG
jgi:PAS domain S-box-containing protein